MRNREAGHAAVLLRLFFDAWVLMLALNARKFYTEQPALYSANPSIQSVQLCIYSVNDCSQRRNIGL